MNTGRYCLLCPSESIEWYSRKHHHKSLHTTLIRAVRNDSQSSSIHIIFQSSSSLTSLARPIFRSASASSLHSSLEQQRKPFIHSIINTTIIKQSLSLLSQFAVLAWPNQYAFAPLQVRTVLSNSLAPSVVHPVLHSAAYLAPTNLPDHGNGPTGSRIGKSRDQNPSNVQGL